MTQQPDETAVPTGDEARDDERVETRSELLPEEQAAGSDNPHDQAEAILAESDERTEDPEGTRRESNQTMDDKRLG